MFKVIVYITNTVKLLPCKIHYQHTTSIYS